VETARRMMRRARLRSGRDRHHEKFQRIAEIAQFGVNLKAGDEVLTTNQDYPRMLTTFQQRARREESF